MIGFLANGIIKNLKNIRRDVERIFAKNLAFKFYISTHPGELKDLAGLALQDGCSTLVIIGGDGSINEVVNGLIHYNTIQEKDKSPKYNWKAIEEIRLGIISAGTGNDFSRSIGANNNINALYNKIKRNKPKLVDVGLASFYDLQLNPTKRFFINITDLGMGGDTVRRMQEGQWKFLPPNLKYMKSIMSSFISYEKNTISCTAENFSFKGPIMSIVIANGEFFGSGLGVAPKADLQDGLFEVVILGDITILDYLKNIPNVRRSKRVKHKEVSYHQFEKLNVESVDGSQLPIDMDGEFAGYAPIEFKCYQQKINFLQ